MSHEEQRVIDLLEARALRRAGELAAELVELPSDDRERVMAELQYHQWLAEACQDCR